MFQKPLVLVLVRTKLLISFFTRDGIRYWFEYWQNKGIHPNLGLNIFTLAVVMERLWLWLGLAGVLSTIWSQFKNKDENKTNYLFLTLIILYFAILSGAVSSAGLRYPVEPLIWLMASNFLAPLLSGLTKYSKSSPLSAGY